MRKYLKIASLSFQQLAEYRFNFAMRLVVNFIWFFAIVGFWSAMANSGMSIQPYTPSTIVAYYFVLACVSTFVGFSFQTVAEDIKNGRISVHVTKPINYLLARYFNTVSEKFMMILLIICFYVIASQFNFIKLNVTLMSIMFFLSSMLIASMGNFLVYFLIGMTAFWLKNMHGLSAVVSISANLVSGSMIPIALMPKLMSEISSLLPFRYFYSFPGEIILGNISFFEIIHGFGIEIVWIFLLLCLYKFFWGKGMKQLEVVGT